MSPVSRLALDLACIASPQLPRDRELALSNLMLLPKFDEKRMPRVAVLGRMAKCLGLALRRGVPAVTAERLYRIAGELAQALAEMPEARGAPPADDSATPSKPPYWNRD